MIEKIALFISMLIIAYLLKALKIRKLSISMSVISFLYLFLFLFNHFSANAEPIRGYYMEVDNHLSKPKPGSWYGIHLNCGENIYNSSIISCRADGIHEGAKGDKFLITGITGCYDKFCEGEIDPDLFYNPISENEFNDFSTNEQSFHGGGMSMEYTIGPKSSSGLTAAGVVAVTIGAALVLWEV